jgi:hypothetical protein
MSDDFRKALNDREFRKRLEAYLIVREPLPRAYDETINEPVPQRLIDLVRGKAEQPRPR